VSLSSYHQRDSARRPYFLSYDHQPVPFYWTRRARTEAALTHRYPRNIPFGYYLSVQEELQLRPPITFPSYWHLWHILDQQLNPEILILNDSGYWEQPFTSIPNYIFVEGEHIPLHFTPQEFENNQYWHNILFIQDVLDNYSSLLVDPYLSHHFVAWIERYIEELGVGRHTNPNDIPTHQGHDFIRPTFPAEHEYPFAGEELEEELKLIPSLADSPIRYDNPDLSPCQTSPSSALPSTGTLKNLRTLRQLSMVRRNTVRIGGYFSRISHTKRHVKKIKKDMRK
jgi:hypothetical protein